MNKRGQVLILAALILSFVIFSLMVRLNIAQRPILQGDFEGLSRNYDEESIKFINLLTEVSLKENLKLEAVAVLFLNFTQDFTRYSKTQNPEFGVIYFFDYEFTIGGQKIGKMLVGNYLDQDIIIWTRQCEEQVVHGCRSKIDAGASFGEFKFHSQIDKFNFECAANLSRGIGDPYIFSFIIGDIEYVSEIALGESKIGVVAHETSEEQRRVYISGIKEGKIADDSFICSRKDKEKFFICNCKMRTRENCDDLRGRCVYCEEEEECVESGDCEK